MLGELHFVYTIHFNSHLISHPVIQNWTPFLHAMDDMDGDDDEVKDDETRWAEGREMALDFMARNFFNPSPGTRAP